MDISCLFAAGYRCKWHLELLLMPIQTQMTQKAVRASQNRIWEVRSLATSERRRKGSMVLQVASSKPFLFVKLKVGYSMKFETSPYCLLSRHQGLLCSTLDCSIYLPNPNEKAHIANGC